MTAKSKSSYDPDHAIPPGKSIQDALDALGWSQTELAVRMNMAHKTINEIVHGKAPITYETAKQLERVIGGSASFWNNRERIYRERLAELRDQEQLQKQSDWLKRLPLKSMISRGLIRASATVAEQIEDALKFYRVASVDAWDKVWMQSSAVASFRSSPTFTKSPEAVSAWLRSGQLAAEQMEVKSFRKDEFKAALKVIRQLSTQPIGAVWQQMVELCSEAGVALVFVPEFPKTHTSGAALWLNSDTPCILMSGRYKADDHFWFTFFHEAGHLLLHGKREAFVDGEPSEDEREVEADRFACDFLIPPTSYREISQRSRLTSSLINEFANQIGVSPGIVVGRLQHEGVIDFRHHNELKQRFDMENLKQA